VTNQKRTGKKQTRQRRRASGDAALGHRIRKFRDQLGLSREQLAHQVERSEGWLLLVENGRADPGYSDLVNLAARLKLAGVRELLGEAPTPNQIGSSSAPATSRLESALVPAGSMVWLESWPEGSHPEEWLEEMRRRAFLQAGVMLTGQIARMVMVADPAIEALDRIRQLEGSLAETIDGLGELAAALGATFFDQPPQQIEPRIAALIDYSCRLLPLSPARYQPGLLTTAGHGLAMVANARFDIGDLLAARASARAAFTYGQRAGDQGLMAWVRDFEGMVASYAGDFGGALRCIEEGRSLAPRPSAVGVRLLGGQARARARLGMAEETMTALRQAEIEYDRLVDSEIRGGLFGIGEMHVPYASSSATAWLKTPAVTQRQAQVVIDADSGPGGPKGGPTRLALARLNLAVALMQQGKPDEAAQLGSVALEDQRRTSSVRTRVQELHAALAGRWPEVREVRELSERYRQAELASG
jgi:transcriptional regulator with XRE-family HTH domain/tetratricopeptide (TPR) repeat protein